MDVAMGAQLAAEALVQKEIDYVFTLSGGHITPIYQFLEGTSVKLFDTRHEQAAVFMAEAWGRMTKKPGIAMVTAGPGFTNALSPIANARMSNSPLVLIAGCVGIESCERLDLQDTCQLPVIEPMVKKAYVCQKPERVAEFVDLAYRTAISGRPGPVYLELPVDVLNAKPDPNLIKRPHTMAGTCCAYDPAAAAKLVEMIQEAQRPVIVAGSGAWYAGAGDELKDFVEKTGVPVFTASMGRGTIPDTHPLCFEGSVGIRPGAALSAYAMADLVIFLGTRLSLYYVFGNIFGASTKFVQVDIEAEEIGRNRSVDLAVVSDIKGLLGECIRVVDEKGAGASLTEKFSPWVKELEEQDRDNKEMSLPDWQSGEVPIHPMRVANEINKFMDRDDDIVIADGGDTQIWMGMTRTARTPARYLDSGLYGCLGVGIPYANAAKLNNPDSRVCLSIGDGSMGFNFMEVETALRKNLPIVIVISNDLGWGMIRHSQTLRLGHAIENGTLIGKVEYQKLVESLGGKGFYVEKPDGIRPALEEAFAANTVACVNVMTNPDTISPGSVALANLGAYGAS